MPILRCERTVRPAEAGIRLDALVGGWLPGRLAEAVSRSAVRRLIMAGAVLVEGRPVRRPGLALQPGWRLVVRVDPARLAPAAGRTGVVSGVEGSGADVREPVGILYRDPWLIGVAKPAGLIVHASADARRPDLFSILRATLGAELASTGGTATPYLGLHHRLDVETSGVMVFTLDEAANRPLARAFAAHEVEKVYHALVAAPGRTVPTHWADHTPLALQGSGRRARMWPDGPGAQAAETAFEIVRRLRSALLVDARPRTGRKHQIRAHLAARGLPILGDARYGGPTAIGGTPVPRVMLHAVWLRLRHPVTGADLVLRCPYPRDFQSLLDCLDRRGGSSLDTPCSSR